MKIGIVSDIHSDIRALEAALALLEQHKVDQIICVGDAVEAGIIGHGDEVVQLLQQNNIPCVMGNHDSYTVGNHAWRLKNADDRTGLLKAETIEYLRNLPEILRYEWEGLRVVVSHGTLWTLFPTSKPHFFTRICEMANADVLILGHTHVAMQAKSGATRIFNSGALCHRYGEPRCAILSLPDFVFTVFNVDTKETIALDLIEI